MQASPVEPINAVVPPALQSFDPREVPVVGVDSGLPAVARRGSTARALRARFATPPAWTPEVRREPRMFDRAPAQAAVLVKVVVMASGGLPSTKTRRQ